MQRRLAPHVKLTGNWPVVKKFDSAKSMSSLEKHRGIFPKFG
jgi:hypothetical protein